MPLLSTNLDVGFRPQPPAHLLHCKDLEELRLGICLVRFEAFGKPIKKEISTASGTLAMYCIGDTRLYLEYYGIYVAYARDKTKPSR